MRGGEKAVVDGAEGRGESGCVKRALRIAAEINVPDGQITQRAVLVALLDQRADRPQQVPDQVVGSDVDVGVAQRVAALEFF